MNSSLMWLIVPAVLLAGLGLGAGLLVGVVAPNVEAGPDARERAEKIIATGARVANMLRLGMLAICAVGTFLGVQHIAATQSPMELTIPLSVLCALGAAVSLIVAEAVVLNGARRRAGWLVPVGERLPSPTGRGWAVVHAAAAVAAYAISASVGSDLLRLLVLVAVVAVPVLEVGVYGVLRGLDYLAGRFTRGSFTAGLDRQRPASEKGWALVVRGVGGVGIAMWLAPALPATLTVVGREVDTVGLGVAVVLFAAVLLLFAAIMTVLIDLADWAWQRKSPSLWRPANQ